MALREIFAAFGFSYDKAKLREINSQVDGVKKTAKEAGGGGGLGALVTGVQGVVAAMAAGVVVTFTDHIREQAAELMDLSEQTGLATDELQAWTLEAQLGGASAQDFTNGLRKLSKELATGVDESGQQSKLFKHLGIDAKDGAGNVRELSAVLPEIAEKFAGLKTGAEKSALAQQIFGRAGTKLVPILSQGAAGVAKLRAQFEELGGGFSADAIKRADEYDDSLIKLNFSFFGLKSLIATSVFPIITDLIGSITKGAVGFTRWIKETTALGSGVKILAGLLTGKLLAALAPFLLPGLKFLAIFLAVDDLIAFLQGKDSVIGALLNKVFGEGSATIVRAWANEVAGAIKGTALGALDLLKIAFSDNDAASQKLWQHFEQVTRPIERILDSIVEKIKLIKDAFTSLETLREGANDFLDLVTSPFDTDADKAQKVKRRTDRAKAISDKADSSGISKAVDNPAHAALSNAFDNIANGIAAPASIRAENPTASVTNNISPIQVTQTFAPGTGPDVKKIAKDAAAAGVKQGLDEYRSALQNLEQRSSK